MVGAIPGVSDRAYGSDHQPTSQASTGAVEPIDGGHPGDPSERLPSMPEQYETRATFPKHERSAGTRSRDAAPVYPTAGGRRRAGARRDPGVRARLAVGAGLALTVIAGGCTADSGGGRGAGLP